MAGITHAARATCRSRDPGVAVQTDSETENIKLTRDPATGSISRRTAQIREARGADGHSKQESPPDAVSERQSQHGQRRSDLRSNPAMACGRVVKAAGATVYLWPNDSDVMGVISSACAASSADMTSWMIARRTLNGADSSIEFHSSQFCTSPEPRVGAPAFVDPVKHTLATMRFAPAEAQGRAVRSYVTQTFTFAVQP
jgi:hypothetical protein